MKPLVDVGAVYSGLKDFQRTTADYVYRRMFEDQDPALRFLVADEVGLGKTLVARGVIARAVDHLQLMGDKRHDIVYICSNAAIARQNLRKLDPTGSDVELLSTRLTMLAVNSERLKRSPINLIAITPGTSLAFGSSNGRFVERALAFALVRRAWGADAVKGAGAARVFYRGITDNSNAPKHLREEADELAGRIARGVMTNFRAELKTSDALRRDNGEKSLRHEFADLALDFKYRRKSYSRSLLQRRTRFIVQIREAMATVGIKALQPDLVILDEFQRFKSLLDTNDQSWARHLARELFEHKDRKTDRPTRTLLLSATPYRMYTAASEVLETDHYADFIATARFLFADERTDELERGLREVRKGIINAGVDNGAAASTACVEVGRLLREVMVRTERLASTPDRNGMLTTRTLPEVTITVADINAYLGTAAVATALEQQETIEYWKSSPYLLNFMEGYALKRALEEKTADGQIDQGLSEILNKGEGLLPWDDVAQYQPIDPGNARLRGLQSDVFECGAWKLLWLPPSLPYYTANSEFESPGAREFTKRLVFSAWQVVPKVISTLMSFEAERRIFERDSEHRTLGYADYSKRPSRLLDFRMEAGKPGGMTTFALLYPSFALAELADPLAISAELQKGDDLPTATAVKKLAASRIKKALRKLPGFVGRRGAEDPRWYWAAPILLDESNNADDFYNWFMAKNIHEAWTGAVAHENSEPQDQRFQDHVDLARNMCRTNLQNTFGSPPSDLGEVLAEIALGAPANTALRALDRLSPGARKDPSALRAAARIAFGFRSLFNGPEVTALIRGREASSDLPYWRAVLAYGVDGNLQATCDEYLYVLREWLGLVGNEPLSKTAAVIAEAAYEALSLRTASYAADVPRLEGGHISWETPTPSMRGKFAVRFGDQRSEEGQLARIQSVSRAFNSPFWPFVLATTSIGQEGLDFHLYCHAVVHWNLPHNPVDLEQREGRVHRYKGHAVRKNVARSCGGSAFQKGVLDPWAAVFQEACKQRPAGECEIFPYWVFGGATDAKIERYLPFLPFTREASQVDALLRSVASYRLAVGQPRQEDLVKYLVPNFAPDELAELVKRIRIDLSPPNILHK